MHPYIRSQARLLCWITGNESSFKTFGLQERLSKSLEEFYSPEDKTEFLNHYMSCENGKLQRHRVRCQKDDCDYMITNRTVAYFVKQELDKIQKDKEKQRIWRYDTIIENLTVNGDAPILNFGKVSGDIKHNIETLNKSGHQDISKDFENLTLAVKNASELQEHERTKYFDLIKFLTQEALKPKEKRESISVLKNIIKYGLGALNAFSSISTIAGGNLTNIANYFFGE